MIGFISRTSLASNHEFLAYLSHMGNYDTSLAPILTSYGKALVTLDDGKEVLHSDCGEHIVRYLIGLSCINQNTDTYDPTIWQWKVDYFKLRPFSRKEGDLYGAIHSFFSANGGRKVSEHSKVKTHNAWSTQVMSYLNEPSKNLDPTNLAMFMTEEKIRNHENRVAYTKPNNNPVCEMNPGIDNTLLVLERLLGDYTDEAPYEELGADLNQNLEQVERDATVSMSTLSFMDPSTSRAWTNKLPRE